MSKFGPAPGSLRQVQNSRYNGHYGQRSFDGDAHAHSHSQGQGQGQGQGDSDRQKRRRRPRPRPRESRGPSVGATVGGSSGGGFSNLSDGVESNGSWWDPDQSGDAASRPWPSITGSGGEGTMGLMEARDSDFDDRGGMPPKSSVTDTDFSLSARDGKGMPIGRPGSSLWLATPDG